MEFSRNHFRRRAAVRQNIVKKIILHDWSTNHKKTFVFQYFLLQTLENLLFLFVFVQKEYKNNCFCCVFVAGWPWPGLAGLGWLAWAGWPGLGWPGLAGLACLAGRAGRSG